MTKQKDSFKTIYIVLGWIAVSLGTIGIVLPVLPTTPFMLLAAWCFAKSSRRYYQWLMYHPKIGRYLRDYKANRGIPSSVKIKVLALLWITMAICIFVIIDHQHVRLLLAAITVAVTTHILTIKTRRKHKTKILILVPTINELKEIPKHQGVVVEQCGVGSIRTAIKTTEVINQYDPQWTILCGWAGAYPESGLSIGDCVSVDSEFEADLGTLRDGKFINIADCDFVDTDNYQAKVCPFSSQAGLPRVTSNSVNRCCTESSGAMIENMEGAGFFQTCLNHGVNFMEIRVISNIVGSAINPQVSENLYQTIVKLINDLSKNEH
jgi:uncharacterized membrane protein YbaN (DUF454 family)/purine-nucleoside phosphorylase